MMQKRKYLSSDNDVFIRLQSSMYPVIRACSHEQKFVPGNTTVMYPETKAFSNEHNCVTANKPTCY